MVPDKVLEALQKDVAEIKVALLGNEYSPDSGLLHRTAKIEMELQKLRGKYDRIIITATTAGAVVSILFTSLMAVLDKFIK